MGYDLSYAEPQGRMALAKRKADEAYEQRAPNWFEMPRPYYYRYSIWGGQKMREALAVTGLLDEVWPGPAFPKYDASMSRTVRAWYEVEVARIIEGDSGGVIPSYKLGSNDGWLVHPAEIQRGIDRGMVERGLLSLEDAYDRNFVRWVIRSMKHGGFRVY